MPWVIKWDDRMISLGNEFIPQGVPFFVISSNDVVNYPQDGPDPMRARALQKGYPFPYLYDESQNVAREYGALVTPHVFLFDGAGKPRYRGALDDNPDLEARPTTTYLKDAIEAIIRHSETTPASTKPVGCSVKWK